jgi:hypothetical protein
MTFSRIIEVSEKEANKKFLLRKQTHHTHVYVLILNERER